MNETPEQLVQWQVDAYNAHDLDAFVVTYKSDAAYVRHPSGEVIIAGVDDIRQSFGDLFAQHPHAHVEIKNRIALGHFVIDLEEITGRAGLPVGHVVAIYEVQAGLIQKVWTLRG